MAMSHLMDAMNTLGGDAEFRTMFDQYIQKECENDTQNYGQNTNSNQDGGGEQDKDSPNTTGSTTSTSPTVSRSQNDPYNQIQHPQLHQPQYQPHHYQHQQGNGPPIQSNGVQHTQSYNQNAGYNPPHPQPHYDQMRPQYHPQIGHPSQYQPQQRFYAPTAHHIQGNGYMMGPDPNSPNPAYGAPLRAPHPGQMQHSSAYSPRPPMVMPSKSPNSEVPSPGTNLPESMNPYGQSEQWASAAGKIKAKPKASKRSSKKKDPNEPQKPASAYALFFRERQAMIKGHNPNASFGEISKIVAAQWDVLDPELKALFKSKTEEAKKDYLQALAAYRASGVATGEQVSPYPSPSGYTYPPSVSSTQSEPSAHLVPPPHRSPGIPTNIHTQQIPANAHQMPAHSNHMPASHQSHAMMPHMPHGMPSNTNPSAVNPNHRLSPQIQQYPNQMTKGNSSPHPDQQVTSSKYDPYGYPHNQSANHIEQSFQGEFTQYISENPKMNSHANPANNSSISGGHREALFNQHNVQPASTSNDLHGQSAGSPDDGEDGKEDNSSQSDHNPNHK